MEIFPCTCTSCGLNPRCRLRKSCICGIPEQTMSVSTFETSLAFEALDSGDKYTQDLGQVRVCAGSTVPTAGPETYLEVLEGLLRRRGLALGHCGSKDTDRGGPRRIFLVLTLFFCFVLLSCWCCCFYYILSFIFDFYSYILNLFSKHII